MGDVEEMMCECVLQMGNSGDGYELVSTLYKYDLFVLSWARVRRADNVWWRCAQYFVIASCG